MRYVFACLLLLLALPATADPLDLERGDVELLDGSLTIRTLIDMPSRAWTFVDGPEPGAPPMGFFPDGGRLIQQPVEQPGTVDATKYSRLDLDGTITDLMLVQSYGPRGYIQHSIEYIDPTTGALWVRSMGSEVAPENPIRIYIVENLPRIRSAGPGGPGDIAPAPVVDESTDPPLRRIEGDGRVDIIDVVQVLRLAVGLDALE